MSAKVPDTKLKLFKKIYHWLLPAESIDDSATVSTFKYAPDRWD